MAALDQTKVDAFTQAMTGILNGGTLALMTSIGHQTGLFGPVTGFVQYAPMLLL